MNRSLEIVPGLHLTGEGAAWLPEEKALIIADVHLGYELAAQRRGGFLPLIARGAAVGERLVAMAAQHGARRLVIAGDLRHSTHDVDDLERQELALFAAVVTRHLSLDVVLGNHDRGGAFIDADVHDTLRLGAVEVVHAPPAEVPEQWTVCGHLHPRVTVRDEAGVAARFPCALVGASILVLPAFSEWAGGTEVRRLLGSLPRGTWRALPMHGGVIADLGLVYDAPI